MLSPACASSPVRKAVRWPHNGQRVEHTTELIMVPSDRRGDMSDHHFIASGIHPSLLREKAELKVLEHADSVTWSIEGRVYEATPTNWRIRGEHAGVDLDLTFEPILPAIWPWGCSEDPTVVPIWYDTMCAVTGTITVAGQTFPIAAHGIREHMTVGPQINNIANNAPHDPIYWDYLVSPDISVLFFRYPGPGRTWHPSTPVARTSITEPVRLPTPCGITGRIVGAVCRFRVSGISFWPHLGAHWC